MGEIKRSCGACAHVRDERYPGDQYEALRCGIVMPSWVPHMVADHGSWVAADDGVKCNAFKRREQKEEKTE